MDLLITNEVNQEINVSQLQNYLYNQLSPEERIQAKYLLSIIDYRKFVGLSISQFKQAFDSK